LIQGERLHLVRGRLAFDFGRFSEAAGEFRKALAANPGSVTARMNLGSSLARLGDATGAGEHFTEILRVDPRNSRAHYNLGLLYATQNQHERAIRHLIFALDSEPNDIEARLLLARELVKAERADEALTEFTRMVEADPGNEDALLDQVDLLLKSKQFDRAVEALEKGHALFPQKGQTAAVLAYLLAASPQLELRNGSRALDLARRVYQATGQINHGAIVAMALAELGRCSEAAEWQRRMLSAAERESRKDLVDKLKADLLRYETARPCRPQASR
jgi:Flp pilus assembly protein TadD